MHTELQVHMGEKAVLQVVIVDTMQVDEVVFHTRIPYHTVDGEHVVQAQLGHDGEHVVEGHKAELV